jgi:hypothetical protein
MKEEGKKKRNNRGETLVPCNALHHAKRTIIGKGGRGKKR